MNTSNLSRQEVAYECQPAWTSSSARCIEPPTSGDSGGDPDTAHALSHHLRHPDTELAATEHIAAHSEL